MNRERAWLARCLATAAILGGALLAVGWVINVPRVTPAGEVMIGIALLSAGAALQLGQALGAVGAAGRRTWMHSRSES